jgi:hypothetical protein
LLMDGELLTHIYEREDMPARNTITRWRAAHPEFDAAIAYARTEQAHGFVDESIDIADTERDPMRARVRIETRLKLARMLKPKEYGDKIDITIHERPSLRGALNEANARLGRPVIDQLPDGTSQVIDPASKFLLIAGDKESQEHTEALSERAREYRQIVEEHDSQAMAELLDLDEKPDPGGTPPPPPKKEVRTHYQGAPEKNDE